MTNSENLVTQEREEMFRHIAAFEAAYSYDASYMRDLYDRSPDALVLFNSARPMASFYEALPAEAHFTAAITVMQEEDCSGCLELNFKLAREAGVSDDVLEALTHSPDELPSELQDVRRHTKACLQTGAIDEVVARRIEEHYGRTALAELATCIVGTRMYPGIKRALGRMQSCQPPSSKVLTND